MLGQFSRVVGLTGTPAPNGLEDLWPQVFLLDRGQRLGRTMRSYLDLYFTTPNSWLPYKHELKPGAEEQIYKKLGDICVSMRAADHLQMPERIDNVVELTLSPREEKLYRQMERDMLLPYADGDVLALNAATLAGKLLQLSNGAVYDEFHNIRVIHDKKLDALEDLIYYVRFNMDGLMRGDYKSRMEGYAIGRQNGWMSANDIRELENMNPIPDADGGNEYLVNGNMIRIAQAAQNGGDQSGA